MLLDRESIERNAGCAALLGMPRVTPPELGDMLSFGPHQELRTWWLSAYDNRKSEIKAAE